MDQLKWENIDNEAPHFPLEVYVTYAGLGVAYFIIQHCFLHVVIKALDAGYSKLESKEMHEYRM